MNTKCYLFIGACIAGFAAVTGCSMLSGTNPTPPTAVERQLFSVTTNFQPRVVTVTNVVTVTQTNLEVKTITLTNTVGVLIPEYVTNYSTVTSYLTNTTLATNLAPVYQLSPGGGSAAVQAVGTAVATPFGWGGLVTLALGGLFSGWLGLRNRALSGTATAATQAAGALTQQIETLLAVLQQTPQGQAAMPAIKNYLITHQAQTGTIQTVMGLIESFVNEPAAKQSAAEILSALNAIEAPPATAKG